MNNNTLYITIWDDDMDRMETLGKNLCEAGRLCDCAIKLAFMSEPPLLARMQFAGKTPVLEIGGVYWHMRSGQTPDTEACTRLLKKFLAAA